MPIEHISTLIVGAGVAGLSLASRVADRPLVMSLKPLGGLIASSRKDGFVFDYGGHVYTTADLAVVSLMRQAGATLHPERQAFFSPEYVPYPVQDYAEKIGLRAGPENPGEKPIKNFVDYCRANLGSEFTERFMVPFNRRVWTINPEKMDFDWVEGRVKVNKDPATKWGMNSSFFYAPGDQIVAVMEFMAHSNGARIEEGFLLSLDEDKHIASFLRHSAREIFDVEYDRIFITTNRFTNQFPSNRIATIGIGFNNELELQPFHWMYCGFESYVHRITWLSRYYEGMAPAGCDSLLLEIPVEARAMPDDVYSVVYGDGPRTGEVVRILQNAGFQANPDSIRTVWGAIVPGYPIPVLGVRKRVADIKQELAKRRIFLAGRWGSHGYFNLQHIFQDAEAAVNFAEHGTSQNEYFNSSFYYKKVEVTK